MDGVTACFNGGIEYVRGCSENTFPNVANLEPNKSANEGWQPDEECEECQARCRRAEVATQGN